ncbi:MAG: hypothetical protein NVS3B21_31860 [Acidimicrobiales bacterium]
MRNFHLAKAIGRRFDVEMLSLTEPSWPEERVDIAPGVRETTTARSPELRALELELSDEVGGPVADFLASRVDLLPRYLDLVGTAARGAVGAVVSGPFLGSALERVAPHLPIAHDSPDVEICLKEPIYRDTERGRVLLGEVAGLEARALDRASLVTACSEDDASLLKARYDVPADKVLVLPNGVSVGDTPFVDLPSRRSCARTWIERFVLLGARPSPVCDLAVFLGGLHVPNRLAAETIIGIAPSHPRLLFLLVGSQSLAFRRRVLPRNVLILGVVSNPAKRILLGTADVALNPMSIGSGTNVKLLDYFAAGIPTVSTQVGVRGIAATADQHFIPSDLEGLGGAITKALAGGEHIQRMTVAARRLVEERYDWEPIEHRYIERVEPLFVSQP